MSKFKLNISYFNKRKDDVKETSNYQIRQRKDPIVDTIGKFGRYQLAVCSGVFIAEISAGLIQLAMIFFTAPTSFTCVNPTNVTDGCSEECTEVEYDRSVFSETIITEWNLICDRAYLAEFSQTIVMFGIMMGSIVFGLWSDKQGRRVTFVTACTILLISSFIVSFVPSFWLFCVVRFITAIATGGMMEISAIVITEVVDEKKCEAVSMLSQVPMNMGHGSLPICSYFLRNWRHFNLSFSIFHIIYFLHIFLFPESPRWLYNNGMVDKSIANLERAAKINGLPTENIRQKIERAYTELPEHTENRDATPADLFRTNELRIITFTMCFEWFFVCFIFFGVSQYISLLEGNIFVNVAVGAWLTAPATLLCIPLTKYMGRKIALILSTVLCGITLLLLAFLSVNASVQLMLITTSLITSSMTMPTDYLYGEKVFPKYVRKVGVKLCAIVGRLAAMIAPFIATLGGKKVWIPAIIFGIFALVVSVICLFTPTIEPDLSTDSSSSDT